MGIEPTLSAWEAEVLPLNYARPVPSGSDASARIPHSRGPVVCKPVSRQATKWKSAPFRVGAIVASPIGAVTAPHSLFPRSFTRQRFTHSCERTCRHRSDDTMTGLPCSAHRARTRRVPPFCRWSEISVSVPSKRTTDHIPFGQSDAGQALRSRFRSLKLDDI